MVKGETRRCGSYVRYVWLNGDCSSFAGMWWQSLEWSVQCKLVHTVQELCSVLQLLFGNDPSDLVT